MLRHDRQQRGRRRLRTELRTDVPDQHCKRLWDVQRDLDLRSQTVQRAEREFKNVMYVEYAGDWEKGAERGWCWDHDL